VLVRAVGSFPHVVYAAKGNAIQGPFVLPRLLRNLREGEGAGKEWRRGEQGKQKFTCVGACRKRILTTFTKQIGVPPRASLETGTFPDLGLHGPLVGGNGDLNTTEIPSPPTGDLS